MYDDRAAPYVRLVPEVDRFKSFHLIEPGGAAHSKGPAVIASLKALHRTRFVGRFLGALRLMWVASALYWLTARNRDLLGRLVRDDPGPTRFRD